MNLDHLLTLATQHRWEILAVVFGIISVYLSTRENIWSWPTALINVGLYFVVFYEAKLYADMGLQVIYIVLALYGWYHWLYGGPRRTTLPVTRGAPHQLLIAAAVGVVGGWAIGALLARFTDASLPYLDASLTSASLVAQWMATRKLLENWVLWIAADIVYVGMFIYKRLYPTAALYLVFTVLAIWGYTRWKASLRGQASGAGLG